MNGSEWLEIVVWWALLLPPTAMALLAVPLSVYVFVTDIWGGNSRLLTAMLLPGIILFSVGIALYFARLLTRQTRKTMRASQERRGRTCRRCGYSLRGNVSGVCPECGTAWRGRELTV